jgi:hypothetical protein
MTCLKKRTRLKSKKKPKKEEETPLPSWRPLWLLLTLSTLLPCMPVITFGVSGYVSPFSPVPSSSCAPFSPDYNPYAEDAKQLAVATYKKEDIVIEV